MKLIWIAIGCFFWIIGLIIQLICIWTHSLLDWVEEWLDYCEYHINRYGR